MKILKFILIFGLCILSFSSCKKDNDLGGDDFPTGKVSFSKFGMQAFFPEDEWEYQSDENVDVMGYEADYKTDRVRAYLTESEEIIDNKPSYPVYISFERFTSLFESEDEANEVINDIKNYYDLFPDEVSVDPITSSKISNYPASKMKSKKTINGFTSLEESYFVYHGKRLYRIAVIVPEKKKDDYYAGCMEIINTLEITDN
jgi:hypothetical protein